MKKIVSFRPLFSTKCIKRAFTVALLALASVAGTDAQSKLSPTDELSPYNYDYFYAITYEWVDSDGVKHVSNLTEPATEYEQIVAMLAEVYTNPLVPGFRKDVAWVPGAIAESSDYPNDFVDVPYEPCIDPANPYGMTSDMTIEPPIEGATALMVELVDDYVYHKDDTPEQMLRKISKITLLTHQRYIDDTVSDNPGYLFNYIGTLNRFFIITKGNNRIITSDTSLLVDGKRVGFAPFYHMFEEFSPSNRVPIYGAFDDMDRGKAFAVDHNCGTVMGQNHIMVMSPDPTSDNFNPDDFRDYAVNFMFFLPDYRFAGDSRKSDNSDFHFDGEWYTYYDEDHAPYFFFNKIKAQITETKNIDAEKARVTLQWNSTYNNIVGYGANEDFYIYRVVNDVISPEPLSHDEYVFIASESDNDYVMNDDGSITTKVATNKIYIYEPRKRFAYDVYYIVKGRRYLTDFELVESNIVDTTITGVIDPPDALSIVIDGDRTSTHNIATHKNSYKHTIKLFDTNYSDEVNIKKKHLRGTNEDDVLVGTTFKLMRYSDLDKSDAVEVARLVIDDVEPNVWNQYLYPFHIEYVNGIPVEDDSFDYFFKTRYYMENDVRIPSGDDEMPVIAPDKTGKDKILAIFRDKFAVSTADGTHPEDYKYFIEYVPAILKGGEVVDYNAESNEVEFVVPHNELKVGYIPYNEQDIQADGVYETRLPLNSPGLQFSVTTNPNVDTYTIYRVRSSNTVPVLRATRLPSGRLSIDRANLNDKLVDYNSLFGSANPAIRMYDQVIQPGDEFDLVVKYASGNTYGNRIRFARDLPGVRIEEFILRHESAKGPRSIAPRAATETYKVFMYVNPTGMVDSSGRDEDFVSRGIRVWGMHNAQDFEGHYDIHNTIEDNEPDVATVVVAQRANNSIDEQRVDVQHEFKAHVATFENPVTFHAGVRSYAQLPESMRISENEGEPGYVVSDTDMTRVTRDTITSGVENVDIDADDAPVEYYNLQGIRLENPVSGTIVIQRKGSKVTKMVMP